MANLDLDFSALLAGLLLLTGVIWGVDHWLFARKRRLALGTEKEPLAVEYSRSFFPVILIVLLVRSFLAEPFRIPSDSMMPTLLDGDFILVNKFAYGLRVPVINKKVVPLGEPTRGDVVVFRYPGRSPTDPERGTDFIKRVIGLPGDHVVVRNSRLYINGQPVDLKPVGHYAGRSRSRDYDREGYIEADEFLPGVEHHILMGPPPTFAAGTEGEWTVTDGHYLVMGDNRNNSADGRVWGLVPEENLVGRAFLIWFSWDRVHGGVEFNRIGTVIK